jgi:lipopolysaccharide assembly LptE-like protein
VKLATTEDTEDVEEQIGGAKRLLLRVLRLSRGGYFVVLAILVTLSTSGCGYSLAGRGSFLPDYIRTIGIPTFANRTTVFNLETQMTQKVRSEFIGRGHYRIVPDAANVDALLTGEVSSVTIQPLSFTDQQLASRYVITMSASVELRDTRENKVLWENPGLLFRQEYEAQGGQTALDPAAFFGQDTDALDRLTTEFARSIVSAILEAF